MLKRIVLIKSNVIMFSEKEYTELGDFVRIL